MQANLSVSPWNRTSLYLKHLLINGYYIYFIHFELGTVESKWSPYIINQPTHTWHIFTGVYSAWFLQVTQTGEWNAIVRSVIASWWYQDSIFPCLQFVLKAASAGVWGAERWIKHEGRIILEGKISRICELDTRHRAEEQKTDAQRDKHAKM